MIEVRSVEGNAEEEPTGCGADEGFQVPPFAEVDEEGVELCFTGWWLGELLEIGDVEWYGG